MLRWTRALYPPRSIAKLVLLGLAVTMAPLVAAVVTAVVRVDGLAADYRAAVIKAEIATEQGRLLVEQLTEMQRALGQFRATGEQARSRYATYLERRQAFRNAAENLTELELGETANENLFALIRDEQALFERIGREVSDASEDEDDAESEWAALHGRARAVGAVTSVLIANEANRGIETAGELQRNLLLQAALVITASLVLAALFVVSITHPLRSLGTAIRQLGAHDYANPVSIRGPQDVEDLGLQLDWLRQRLSELEHQKVTFLRHISHELKTPLTTLREGSELLAESLADAAPEEAEISRLMKANSVHLQKLIEGLLQFGKTQQPVTNLILEANVALRDLIQSVISAQLVAASAKDIIVVTALADVSVAGDRAKVRIVVDNLLTNAIKYTPSGGRIRVGLVRTGPTACIDVEDTGPGVADDERQSIFEPFVQGHAMYHASVRGTGLGLAIAKEYVGSHNGRIEVVPCATGAHFRVTLPVDGPGSRKETA